MIGCAKAWNSPRICADACTDITLIVYTRADIILIHTLSDIVLIEHIFLLSAQPPHSANAKRARAGDRGGKGAEGRRRGEGCRSRHGRRFGSLLAPIPSPNQRRTAGPGTHRAARHAASREHWHPRAPDPPPVRRPIFAARKRWAGRTRPSTHALGQPSPAGPWGLRTDAARRGTEAFFRPPTPPGARPDLLFLTPAKNPPSAGPVMRPMGDLRTRNRKTRSPVQEHLLLLRRTRPSVP